MDNTFFLSSYLEFISMNLYGYPKNVVKNYSTNQDEKLRAYFLFIYLLAEQ